MSPVTKQASPATLLCAAILPLAALQLAGGVTGFAFGTAFPAVSSPGPQPVLSLVVMLAFASAGALLVIGGRRDRRALYLGSAFMLVATSFSTRLALRLVPVMPAGQALFELLARVTPDAFTPFFFWLFVRDFPESQASYRLTAIVRSGIRVCAAVGALFFAVNLLLAPPLLAPLSQLRTGGSASVYYAVLLPLTAAALPVAVHKARTARQTERRRLRLFMAALVLSTGPVAIEVLLEAVIPGYYRFVTDPSVNVFYALAVYPLLIFLPFATAHAVLVHHVVEVRLVVRRALQYALARYSVITMAALPFVGFGWHLYREQARTLADLLSGTDLLLIGAAAFASLALLRVRSRLLDALDRRFFRERYDARRALTDLARLTIAARSEAEVATMLQTGIDDVLHVERVSLLVADPQTHSLVAPDGAVRPLSLSSMLAGLVAGSSEPLEVDLDQSGSALARLPQTDREWLADSAFHLLVPIYGETGSLIGVLAAGEKRSELPFDEEDHQLLSAIAASAGVKIETHQLRSSRSTVTEPEVATPNARAPNDDGAGMECTACGVLCPSRSLSCPACWADVATAPVPYVLAQKFRFERRLGAGGMGIVYQAVDLALLRAVAIKTLPRISPEAVLRLRREAHAAARVSHPHLAIIYGVETWYGRPMLILELLDGGTLADRLRHGPLPVNEVIELGLSFADALKHAHAAGILHGDIKPSNIGFRRDGVPKLLDFGVARMLDDAGGFTRPLLAISDSAPTTDGFPMGLITGTVAGTLPYLSPEVVRGDRPDASLDLWSLAIVLHEALTGRNPVSGHSAPDTMIRIREAAIDDVRLARSDCPPDLASFLATALAVDRRRRPASAGEFHARLTAMYALGKPTTQA